jgi:glycosyltransferase involved in cell wall biosynthesis
MPRTLDIVIPVLNEERALPPSTRKLHGFMSQHLGEYDWRIIIADNGSTDATLDIARLLSEELPGVSVMRLEQRGRGLALRTAWTKSKADIVGYMDVDLSTDLSALPPLIRAVDQDGYDIAVGSRLIKGAHVSKRPFKRELTSRAYSLIFRTMFLTSFCDAQCGFKALTRDAVEQIVPLVGSTRWFFDSELLILAEKNGFRIKEVPVTWTDDPDTRVKILGTAYEDMEGLMRLRFDGFLKGLIRMRLWGLRKASRLLSGRRSSTRR